MRGEDDRYIINYSYNTTDEEKKLAEKKSQIIKYHSVNVSPTTVSGKAHSN